MRIAMQPTQRPPMYPAPRSARPVTFPAPVRGWVTNTNLSAPVDQAALVLDNWIPGQTGIKVRGGCAKYATLPAACTAMWIYESGPTEKLFAATGTAIYDITTVANPASAPSADVSSLTGGDWSFVQFETSGGDFLVGVNGTDTPREYDGTSWSTSTMSHGGLTTSTLSHVWAFKERLFFIQGGTMNFWYLPAGAKTGNLTQFSLAGVFGKGGGLLFGGTWSLDAGDGVDDLCVIVSTLGEVAVYKGDNPNSANSWALVGRYEIAKPLGKHAIERAGGELLVATIEGVVPISEAVSKDRAALSLSAISRAIEPDWTVAVKDRSGLPWSMLKVVEKNLMFVGTPSPSASVEKACFLVNLETGAWARYTGAPWEIRAQAALLGVHYTGTGTGVIYQTDTGGSDDGLIYVAKYAGHFSPLGANAAIKSCNLVRANFRATRAFIAQVSGSVDFSVAFPAAPGSVANSTEDTWDTGLWDTALWDAPSASLSVTSNWQSIAKAGFVFAPQVQITSGITPKPDAELMSFDVQYETGAIVV